LEAIKDQMNARHVFFNDKEFRRKGLCTKENATHNNHYHIRIRPPARRDGVVSVYDLGSKVVKEAYAKMSKAANGLYEAVEDAYEAVTGWLD
jgi:hypothetical protein